MLKLGVHKTFKGKRLYTEVWKDVVGYEGYYKVSNLGRVRSLDRIVKCVGTGQAKRKGRVLKGHTKKDGYIRVHLSDGRKSKVWLIHRLVAKAFLSNLENKKEVDHINTIKTDNRVCNLRWVTRVENNNNELTRKHRGEALKGKRRSDEQIMRMREISPFKMKVMCIETGMVYESANEASRQTGIPQGHISRSCREKQRTARGFHWRYI